MQDIYSQWTELVWTTEHTVIASQRHTNVKLECDNLLQSRRRKKQVSSHLTDLIAQQLPECDAIITVANGANCLARPVAQGLTKKLGHTVVGLETLKTKSEAGFMLANGNVHARKFQRIMLLDDVFTRGTNAGQVASVVEQFGGQVHGLATMFNRNPYGITELVFSGSSDPVSSLIQIPIPDWAAADCKEC